MTSRFIWTALVLGGTAFAASAMTEMDGDGDGALSVEEFLAGYPTLTVTEFEAADTDADGVIDADEFEAAVTAGTLPEES